MHVAIIGIKGLPAKGGGERVVEAIVRRMVSKGVAVSVYCDSHYTPEEYSPEGIRLIRIPAVQGKYTRTLTLVLFSAIHAVLFEDFDLVHLHNIEVSFAAPILRLKYKVFSTGHGFAYWRSKWGPIAKGLMKLMDYFFVRFSTAVSCVSAKDAVNLETRFGKKVRYIANGVGTEFSPDFKGADLIMRDQDISPDGYFIFVAGRIEPTKGAHLAVDAFMRLGKDIKLLVVGDDSHAPEYGAELQRKAGKMVRFQKLIDDPRILFALMRQSVCLIFPSLFEAMSMVLLEAASLGIPVICSDIEENREVLGEDGIYFKSGDVESLTDKLKWILDHRQEADAIASRIQADVHKNFSWDRITDQYLQVYSELVGNKW